jgi:hypothetical protein
MEEIVLNFSDERIKKIRNISYTIFLSVPIFLAIFFSINKSIFFLNISTIIIVFIMTLTIIEGTLIIQFKTMIKRYRERQKLF